MTDYRKYSNVTKVWSIGYMNRDHFLSLDCGHEVYRYSKTPPKKVKCEKCLRDAQKLADAAMRAVL